MAPAVGILCAWRLRHEGESPLKGFILGFATVFCALIGCSFLAIFIFPGYPNVPVSEPIAVSLTVPVIIASIFAIWLITRKRSVHNRFPFGGASALLALYLVGIFMAYQMFTWPYRRALPWSASEVKEYAWTDGFLPDFVYCLRARVTEEQFRDYVVHFELASAGSQEHFPVTDEEVSWWKPSPGAHEVFRLEDGDWEMEAVFDNGIMWVMAGEH